MTAKLIDGSLDVAIALTEGLLAGIAKGHDAYKIIGTYVESPLCKRGKRSQLHWHVHTRDSAQCCVQVTDAE